MPVYTFATGVPNITPAVYAVSDTETDLNETPTATAANGVLTLTLDVGDYYAEWRWEGDTHHAGGEVANPAGVQSLGEFTSGGSSPVTGIYFGTGTPFVPGGAVALDPTFTGPLSPSTPLTPGLALDAGGTTWSAPEGTFIGTLGFMVNVPAAMDDTTRFSAQIFTDLTGDGFVFDVWGQGEDAQVFYSFTGMNDNGSNVADVPFLSIAPLTAVPAGLTIGQVDVLLTFLTYSDLAP